MITAFLSHDHVIAESITRELSLEKIEDTGTRKVYRKKTFLFFLTKDPPTEKDTEWVRENFMPDVFVFPFIGFSVSSQHEMGDIVFPNAFLSYNPLVQMKQFTKENHHTLMGTAEFLDVFPLQRDYQVEDFGLSIGGIAVGKVILQDTEHFMSALDFTYEGDIYSTEDLLALLHLVKHMEHSAYILGYVGNAKKTGPRFDPSNMGENILASLSLMLDNS